jgi:hypothetical protein
MSVLASPNSLFQRGRNRLKRGFEMTADPCNDRDDCEGNSRCDQPILDCGSSIFILEGSDQLEGIRSFS